MAFHLIFVCYDLHGSYIITNYHFGQHEETSNEYNAVCDDAEMEITESIFAIKGALPAYRTNQNQHPFE